MNKYSKEEVIDAVREYLINVNRTIKTKRTLTGKDYAHIGVVVNALDEKEKKEKKEKSIKEPVRERFNSDGFLDKVCLSHIHNYGIMSEEAKGKFKFECRELMNAILKNL